MSVSKAISAHVPYLRRFSRALTGTQAGGDAYVLATLETLVAEPGTLADTSDLRVDLYRLFLKVWESMPVNGDTDTSPVDMAPFSADEIGALRNLAAIPPAPRIAFLLSALENFNAEEIARILDCAPQAARDLIDRAGKEISKQIRTDVLIIEDEPLIAIDIQMLVEELGHRVVAIARTRDEAVAAAKANPPGLILADIQLADGSSGLDAVNKILSDFAVPVIFITAYPERFLTGTPPEPAFLITKPFGVDSLKAVISQALFFDRKSQQKAPPNQSPALV
jgi:DNA-directed RNA polymerase specialized sigma24 family protein